MLRIGLLSDTHGYIDPLLFHYFAECDEIWHAGDIGTLAQADELATFKPLKAVYGNIDGADVRSEYPLIQSFCCEQVQVFMIHIGGYPGRYSQGVKKQLADTGTQLFITGHSHILKVMRDPSLNNMLHLNPGAAGVHGFHKMKTAMRFTIDGTAVREVEIIELGLRGEQPSLS